MKSYTVYLGDHPIVDCIYNTETAYSCFEATKSIASLTENNASLVWDETGEVIAYYEHSEEEGYEPADIDDDCGYDPYMGCYTDDC